MLLSYNKIVLSKSKTRDEANAYFYGHEKSGLEWNQYIGRIIINDFIKQLDDYDGTDFADYMNVLPYIEYGMFQSAIKLIKQINIEGLETIKTWLLKSLTEGEDRYE